MPSNEAQQQLNTPKMQRGDLESCEVLSVIDPISSSELNVAARKTRNTETYPRQSISEQHGKGEPRAKTRKSKKGSSRKAISENSELSSAPSRVCDDQQHGLEGNLLDGDTAHVKRGSNEDSSGALTQGNLSVQMQGQLVEENGLLSPPKLGSSISPDGGKSVNSFPNQGCFSQFFDGLDWMIQPSYYQESSGIQSVSASENIFSPSADIPSTINTDTLETFQNSCLSDSFPNSIQDFIGSPDLNSLTFLSPDMQNFDVHHDGSNLPSTSNSYVQMSFSEDSGTQMESIQRSMNNTSCSQPQTTDGFDLGMYSRLPSLKESQVLSLPEIHNSSRGTSVCSMDATTEYSMERSGKPMKPPVRTYTKVCLKNMKHLLRVL
jgi:auxin response factor